MTILLNSALVGCFGSMPHTLVSDYGNMGIRRIAVLPVSDQAGCNDVLGIIREETVNELYFKGYAKVSLKDMDEKLLTVYPASILQHAEQMPPGAIGQLLGVDAVMYITLNQYKNKIHFLYASTSLAVSFELRSVDTGMTLWQTSCGMTERNYDFTKKELDMKTVMVFETVVQQVVDKAMATLPEGLGSKLDKPVK
jgi:hypothetical protein